jgi:three-Cys-motif partner protein
MSEVVLWPLEPHTGAKHALLKTYLDRWFPILGRHHQRINYIDGFAGPGEYEGGEKGSPILAIESALEHVSRGSLDPQVTINFIFVESEKDHADHLRGLLSKMAVPQQFKIAVIDGAFRDQIGGILDKIEAEKKVLAPTFAFVDPFGFSGIPFSLMTRILKFQRCEVFVNIMVDFINRFLEHPNDAITAHFPETFGTNDVMNIPEEPGNRLNQILTLYRHQLRGHAKFVGRFDMHGRKDRKTYSMFFATNAAKGFEKMKEAMWSVDKYTGNKFSDADPNPVSLFESWGFEQLWDHLRMKFAGSTVKMSDLEVFVIEQTDYLPTHARKILTEREESGEITVEPLPGCKRRGKTFPSEKVRIVFPT